LPILDVKEGPKNRASRSNGSIKVDIVEEVRRAIETKSKSHELADLDGNFLNDATTQFVGVRFESRNSFTSLPILRIPMMLSMYPELQTHGVKELVHHYDHNLAPTLVWVDSFNNPWRNVILPLAYAEPSLLFSVLALAAEHLSQRASEDSLQRIHHHNNACMFRDRSLKLLANHLKDEMQGRYDGRPERQRERKRDLPNATFTKIILATMLMLVQYEMVCAESLVWKVHLQASHTMIQSWLLTPSRLDVNDADNKFLLKETFTINAFAATSSFADEEDAPVFDDSDETLFGGFMTAIHDITRYERRISLGKATFLPELPFLEARLETARASTQRLAANYDKLQPKAIRLDFDRVVDIYHHAGIIYAYQALATPESAQPAIGLRLDLLVEALHLLPASGLFAQDLVWPLFIASTECRYREHERRWLQQKMEDSADATGFGSCHQAWEFLRKWWDQDEDASRYSTWIGYARARAERGHTFLVF
jgi:hypothetical protein